VRLRVLAGNQAAKAISQSAATLRLGNGHLNAPYSENGTQEEFSWHIQSVAYRIAEGQERVDYLVSDVITSHALTFGRDSEDQISNTCARSAQGRGTLESRVWTNRLTGASRCRTIALQRDGMIRHYGCVQTVFEAAGGMDGLRRLAGAWHRRVMADDVVGHAFSHGFHPEHVERLAAYWAEALGGPSAYTDSYGDETTVVKTHSGKGEHVEMDRRAIACFDQALADVGLDDGTLRQVLHDYFAWATNTTMSLYHQSADDVPDGLRIPHWSWDGLQT
jgi:hemoglobin